MSDALTRIMNLPCTGFDNDGEETVNREAAAAIVQELEARLADKYDAGFIIFQALILAASGEPGISTPGNKLRSAAVTMFGEDAVNKALGKLAP